MNHGALGMTATRVVVEVTRMGGDEEGHRARVPLTSAGEPAAAAPEADTPVELPPERIFRGWPLVDVERRADGLVETDILFSAWRWGRGPQERYRYLLPLHWSHADLHSPERRLRGQARCCWERKSRSFLGGASLGSIPKHRGWGVAANDISSAERLELGKESLRLGGRTGRDRSA